jgi:transposase-like protein
MPWQEVTRVSLRKEFVMLAMQPGSNRRELCRRFGIAPKTGYKWLARYAEQGPSGLDDRSRRPRRSPTRTAAEVEHSVIRLRMSRATRGADASSRACSKTRVARRSRRAP